MFFYYMSCISLILTIWKIIEAPLNHIVDHLTCYGLELLRTNNPHKYSTLALYLSFWEVVAVWISRWCFHASESWQFFNPSLDFQKGKLVHQHLCWDAPGVSMFSKQGIVGRKMSKTTIHLHQIWFPHRWVIEWPRDALPVAFANEALVPDPRA